MYRNFGEIDLSYEEWKSVLHLSTRWGFASIRRLALTAIKPPTPYDRLLLARTYSVDDWVVPALSALCERTEPLTLSEARQMDIEDVVLVVTVREGIRSRTLQAKVAEVSHYVEAAQAGIHAGCEAFAAPLSTPKRGNSVPTPSPVVQKQAAKEEDAREQGSERPVSPVAASPYRPNGIDPGKERGRRKGHRAGRWTAAHHKRPSAGGSNDAYGQGQCAWGCCYRRVFWGQGC